MKRFEASATYVEKLILHNSIIRTAELLNTSENTLRRFMKENGIVNKRTVGQRPMDYGSMVYMFSEEFGCWATSIHFKTSQDAVHTIRVRYKRKAMKLLETFNKD